MAVSGRWLVVFYSELFVLKALFVILLIGLVSCSPQKRLGNLIKNHPELIIHDTAYVHDTTVTSEIISDTTVILKPVRDTITITKDKYHVQIIRTHDTLTVSGGCLPDTVYSEKIIYSNDVNPVHNICQIPFWIWLIIGFLVILLLLKILKIF